MPINRMPARVAPPVAYHRGEPDRLRSIDALLAAVVEIVSVAVPAAVPLMFTGVVDPKLNVGRSVAPAGLDVITAVKVTSPVKPPAGVTVIIDVFAVVAPRDTLTAVPVMRKLGTTGAVTVTVAVPVALLYVNELAPSGL